VTRFAKLVHASPLTRADKARLLKPTWDGRTERAAVEVAADRMRDARRGWPSSGGGPGQKGGVSDPTSVRATERDLGGNELARLARSIITGDGNTAVKILNAWTPRAASAKAIRETRFANDIGCDHCRALGLPVELARSPTRTTVGGRLPVALRLCTTHYNHARNHGRLPTRAEHEQGQRHAPRRRIDPKLLITAEKIR